MENRHNKGQTSRVSNVHIISCPGLMFDGNIFDNNSKPELTIKKPFSNQTTEWKSVNTQNLFL